MPIVLTGPRRRPRSPLPWLRRARRRRHSAAPWPDRNRADAGRWRAPPPALRQASARHASEPAAPPRLGPLARVCGPELLSTSRRRPRRSTAGNSERAGAAGRLADQATARIDGACGHEVASLPRRRCPASALRSAPTSRPLAAISAAATTPARRGRRCVPPAPGTMPSFTSGRPKFRGGRGDAGDGSRARSPARRRALRR